MVSSTKGEKRQTRKRLWTEEEDMILVNYVNAHGRGQWNRLAKKTGLKRCGKSCRLRWMNYLSPNVNRGDFTKEEDDLIIRLHRLLGNRWSMIAKRVPGRTDNQVKNHWNSHLNKKLQVPKEQDIIRADASSCTRVREGSDSSSSPCIDLVAPDNHSKEDVSAKTQVEPLLVKNDYMGSLCVLDHDDALELSAFGCLDFLDGYCFKLD